MEWKKQMLALAICAVFLVNMCGAVSAIPTTDDSLTATENTNIVKTPTTTLPKFNTPETYLKAEAESIDVLLVVADSDASVAEVQTYLSSFPDITTIDIFEAQTGTPTLSYLQNYDAVLVWSNSVFDDAVALGDVLADYVDVGGGVVLGTFVWYGPSCDLEGRLIDEEYTPFVQAGSSLYSWSDLGWYDAGHPIMTGVSSISGYFRDDVSLTSGANLIAKWDDDHLFVAEKGPVVGVALFPGVALSYNWTGDVPTLIHNSLVWTTGPIEELTVSITTDSFEYLLGDTMTVSLDIANPTSDPVTFEWYIGAPQLDIWVTYASAPIPVGFDNSYTIPIPISDWGPTPFGLVHYVHMLDPVSGDVLVQDVALCAYRPGVGKAMPVDIEEEIIKTIEKVELPN